jgi:hypothetical protein
MAVNMNKQKRRKGKSLKIREIVFGPGSAAADIF